MVPESGHGAYQAWQTTPLAGSRRPRVPFAAVESGRRAARLNADALYGFVRQVTHENDA